MTTSDISQKAKQHSSHCIPYDYKQHMNILDFKMSKCICITALQKLTNSTFPMKLLIDFKMAGELPQRILCLDC